MNVFSNIMSFGVSGDAMWVRISNIFKGFLDTGNNGALFHYSVKLPMSKKVSKSDLYKYESFFHVSETIMCNFLSVFYKFLREIHDNDFDLIYGNTFLGAIVPILLKPFHKKPVIVDVHGLATAEYDLLGHKHSLTMLFCILLEFFCFKFADKIICVSMSMVDYLEKEKGICSNKLFYVTNGVDLKFYNQVNDGLVTKLKKELGIQDKFIFGYIGGFQKWQGIDNYLDAAKKTLRDDVAFIFVGGDEDFRDGNIINISKKSKDQVSLYYSICDVLVLPRPSHIATEVAAPTKFAEYTSMGKPVLTTNVGDAAKYVKEYNNGVVAHNNSVDSLCLCINHFLDLGSDIVGEMGLNSRELARDNFDWDKLNIKIKQILSDGQDI